MIPITSLSVYREHYRPGDPKNPSIIKPHKYVSHKVGWIFSRDTSDLCGNVSYRGISAENTIFPDVKTEIKDHSVYLNGVLIATAPGNKNKAQKDKFCKSVVWALINDSTSLHDKLAEIAVPVQPAMPEKVIPKQFIDNPYGLIDYIKTNNPSIIMLRKEIIAGYVPWLNLTITEEVIA
jgi:hypothetical protein